MAVIGFIGLGNMGGPMAANLVKAGHDVRGFDLSADSLKRFEEAIRHGERSVELEAYSLNPNANAGYTYYAMRQYDRAIERLRETLELDPNSINSLSHIGLAYLRAGRYREAIDSFSSVAGLTGDAPGAVSLLGLAYAKAGKRDLAEEVLEKLSRASETRYVSPFDWAFVYMGLGETDRVFEYLQQAAANRCWFVTLLTVDPMFDVLRSDPRYEELARRLGFP